MIDMLKRHEIQVLRRAGHSLDEVAELAGVSRRSVVRVEDEEAVGQVDNAAAAGPARGSAGLRRRSRFGPSSSSSSRRSRNCCRWRWCGGRSWPATGAARAPSTR